MFPISANNSVSIFFFLWNLTLVLVCVLLVNDATVSSCWLSSLEEAHDYVLASYFILLGFYY